jgi:hypothetical protein
MSSTTLPSARLAFTTGNLVLRNVSVGMRPATVQIDGSVTTDVTADLPGGLDIGDQRVSAECIRSAQLRHELSGHLYRDREQCDEWHRPEDTPTAQHRVDRAVRRGTQRHPSRSPTWVDSHSRLLHLAPFLQKGRNNANSDAKREPSRESRLR